jgi:hypothetical protein
MDDLHRFVLHRRRPTSLDLETVRTGAKLRLLANEAAAALQNYMGQRVFSEMMIRLMSASAKVVQ